MIFEKRHLQVIPALPSFPPPCLPRLLQINLRNLFHQNLLANRDQLHNFKNISVQLILIIVGILRQTKMPMLSSVRHSGCNFLCAKPVTWLIERLAASRLSANSNGLIALDDDQDVPDVHRELDLAFGFEGHYLQ